MILWNIISIKRLKIIFEEEAAKLTLTFKEIDSIGQFELAELVSKGMAAILQEYRTY